MTIWWVALWGLVLAFSLAYRAGEWRDLAHDGLGRAVAGFCVMAFMQAVLIITFAVLWYSAIDLLRLAT